MPNEPAETAPTERDRDWQTQADVNVLRIPKLGKGLDLPGILSDSLKLVTDKRRDKRCDGKGL